MWGRFLVLARDPRVLHSIRSIRCRMICTLWCQNQVCPVTTTSCPLQPLHHTELWSVHCQTLRYQRGTPPVLAPAISIMDKLTKAQFRLHNTVDKTITIQDKWPNLVDKTTTVLARSGQDRTVSTFWTTANNQILVTQEHMSSK